ncbi:unnamed protein product [Leptosia nina]|uniref:Major facilitator superfamily (MFS) profile domain-containing protein n=1 Tax=Leptosia nina TaxID=320188 RepID=A0AAV1IWU4_9NEOP
MDQSYTLVAPDGGFGYVVLIAVIINWSILGTHINCFGIIYSGFFQELKMSSANVTVLAGVSAMISAIGGFVTAPLLKFLSKRKTLLLGTFLYNCGLLGTAFSESKIIFYISQGIIVNAGYGIMYNISNTIINEYFINKRIIAIGFAQTIVAFVAFVEPQIFKWTTEWYGHRGTMIFICALSVHAFAAGMLMQPVAWHMKKVPVPRKTEMKTLLNENTEISQTPETVSADIKEKERLVTRLKNLIDMEVVKSYTLSIECLGPAISVIIDLTYLYMLPPAFRSYGWSESDVAWAFSLIALGDLFMRISLILLSKWFNNFGSSRVYIAGVMLAFITRLGFAAFDNVTVALILFTLMGVSRCILFVVLLLVISEAVGPDKYISAMGIFMMCAGCANLTLAPIIGTIRDYTDSYTIALNLITGIFGMIGITWIGKLVFRGLKNRRNIISRKKDMS